MIMNTSRLFMLNADEEILSDSVNSKRTAYWGRSALLVEAVWYVLMNGLSVKPNSVWALSNNISVGRSLTRFVERVRIFSIHAECAVCDEF